MNEQIIRKNEIETMEGTLKKHFLNNNAIRLDKSIGHLAGLENLGFHIIEVQPGYKSTEYHFHHCEDECAYILTGEATMTIGTRQYEVGPGDFVAYPAGGEAHTMENTGSTVLTCIIVGQHLKYDVVDYPNVEKRLYRNGEVSDLVDLTKPSRA
ncbi:MAG: putative cupin superfamily protein [Oceanicoccus sp.]|jgi:uncharacterized cupin superfamily protein